MPRFCAYATLIHEAPGLFDGGVCSIKGCSMKEVYEDLSQKAQALINYLKTADARHCEITAGTWEKSVFTAGEKVNVTS